MHCAHTNIHSELHSDPDRPYERFGRMTRTLFYFLYTLNEITLILQNRVALQNTISIKLIGRGNSGESLSGLLISLT